MQHVNNFQDMAMFFANSIATFLRQDEEYRAAWRYKHKQEALKIPRREALKNASAWADLVSDHLQQQEEPDTLERYAGKMWRAWEEFITTRDSHISDKSAESLKRLKESEQALKTTVRSVNALLQ